MNMDEKCVYEPCDGDAGAAEPLAGDDTGTRTPQCWFGSYAAKLADGVARGTIASIE